MPIGGKQPAGLLDGTPEKRLFWSIISDYNTITALCELVDNAVDRWWTTKDDHSLRVTLDLDIERQTIVVEDNAGGVAESELRLLIAPGGSNNDPNAEMIGVFGVGSKRAAVALAETVTIRTRQGSGPAFQVEITKEWIGSDDWEMPVYEVTPGPENTTTVSMTALRRVIDNADVEALVPHLGAVYGSFLESGRFELKVNGLNVAPIRFDHWAFPKDHDPRRASFDIELGEDGFVRVSITAGLIRDRVPDEDNYGAYFYCNGRLVAKHLKDRECGYFSGSPAGVPHPDASLARTIVNIDGPAKLMPWNSSKTGVNFSHPVFKEIEEVMLPLVGHFSSLSRRLKPTWERDVFRRTKGEVVDLDPEEAVKGKRLHLPELPRVQKTRGDRLVAQNRQIVEDMPWTLGLVEAVAAVDTICRQRLHTRNRHALILLDSTFEIALKEFIVHRTDLFPPSQYGDKELANLFSRRSDVIKAVDARAKITPALLSRAQHYYNVRNKLIHERATVEVLEIDIRNYRTAIQQILQILFGLNVA